VGEDDEEERKNLEKSASVWDDRDGKQEPDVNIESNSFRSALLVASIDLHEHYLLPSCSHFDVIKVLVCSGAALLLVSWEPTAL
jgi:hypothetical protein